MTRADGADAVAEAVGRLSAAFAARDVDAVLACFAPGDAVLYAGSEEGEVAVGRDGLRALLTDVLGRDEAYAFAPLAGAVVPVGRALHVVCEARGSATAAGEREDFPYRLSGVLEEHAGHWLWRSLTGSEPAPAAP
ncbi:nuclear transport factor 2 family protein [Vallicoccus soli]|uniref:SnoaL-like domain-containing protein n=1 Tax=Vallicoccus soli TaxID=2339232 RepID=A0A3A3YYN0_9ACTN|nr:nuclear transport factor 2 family protein [Vallicoccus soli]RJK93157.1 hypothetical protein D5H78_17250 [Vallicoccus soli]